MIYPFIFNNEQEKIPDGYVKHRGRLIKLYQPSYACEDYYQTKGEPKMIEVKKSYTITFSEEQAKQLYFLLREVSNCGNLSIDTRYCDLREIYEELKPIFDSGIL